MQFHREARKQFLKLPKKIQSKILKITFELAVDPLMGEKLQGELKGKYKIKIPPYRIIYEIFHDQLLILVLKVGHRQNAYK